MSIFTIGQDRANEGLHWTVVGRSGQARTCRDLWGKEGALRAEPFLFVFGAIRVSIASLVVFYAFVFIYEWDYDGTYCYFWDRGSGFGRPWCFQLLLIVGTEAVASDAPGCNEGTHLA